MFKKLNRPGDEEYGFPATDGIYQRDEWKTWHYIVAVLLLFPVVCIPILFALVANANHTTKNYYGSAISSFTSVGSIEGGNVVSIAPDGSIQAGAGTSVYKNIVRLTLPCPDFLTMDSVYGNTYVLSYADEGTKKASLQVVTVASSTPDTGKIEYTVDTPYNIVELVTLNAATGLFVGITQDIDTDAQTGYVVAGKVNEQSHQIGNLVKSDEYGGNYSVSPVVIPLSKTTFAIGYYSDDLKIVTKYGKVDTTTLSITLYDSAVLLNDPESSHNFDLVGMTESSFMVVYHDSTVQVEPYYGYGTLQTRLASVNTDTGAVTVSDEVTLLGSTAIYSLAATRISDTVAVVAYSDYSSNYGIRAQLIQLETADTITTPVFGQSWLITAAKASAVVNGGMMDLDAVTISEDEGTFLVAFSDFSNNGAMTAAMGRVLSSDLSVSRASANYLLNSGSADVESAYSWAALAVGDGASLASTTAILTSVTNKDCSVAATTNFAMMNILPLPVGVTPPSGSTSSGAVDVAMGGSVSGFSSLVQGYSYYADTMGRLVQGDTYYGRDDSSEDFAYVTDDVANKIVTVDSKIGFAADANTMFIRT